MPTIDLTVTDALSAGSKRSSTFLYTGPASYATGGDALVASDINLGQIHNFPSVTLTDGSNVVFGVYDYTAEKLQMFQYVDVASPAADTFDEVAATTDLSTFTARIEVTGI